MKKILLKVSTACIVAFIIGLVMGNTISATAETNKVNESTGISNVQSTNAVQGVSYDYVYVGGTRYIVFMSSTGDIEIVR